MPALNTSTAAGLGKGPTVTRILSSVLRSRLVFIAAIKALSGITL